MWNIKDPCVVTSHLSFGPGSTNIRLRLSDMCSTPQPTTPPRHLFCSGPSTPLAIPRSVHQKKEQEKNNNSIPERHSGTDLVSTH